MEKKHKKKDGDSDKSYKPIIPEKLTVQKTIRAAILIQRWYRRYVARLEMRRRCTWRIFQSIEYAGEHDHMKLSHFFDYLMTNFTPKNTKEKEFLTRILSDSNTAKRTNVEKSMESMVVPSSYKGPRLGFPLKPDDAVNVLEAFRNNQQLHPYYVLKLFKETEHYLSQLPNINRISTCYSEEITVCGDLHGQIFDLFHIFYKNGLPSPQKVYVFNGDLVDRGQNSMEILIIIFVFLLIYPKEVHVNRGNHEDFMINFRYGFTREVTRKYKDHANKLLAVIKNVFSSMPLATVVDRKVLIVHGGISDKTDLDRLAKVERCKILSVLAPKRRKTVFYTQSEAGRSGSMHSNSHEGQERVEKILGLGSSMDSESSSYDDDDDDDDIEQVVDILWSDPDPKPGCTENIERGGGCYFGPDVTDMFLQKHGLQFIIRSHECKPDGYEFDHNRKVITIFSASNYYSVGSNRGAYIKMGPDLIPHFFQFQATKGVIRQMNVTQRISRVEESAYQILKEQLFANRSELISVFRGYDKKNTGLISVNDWAKGIESVLHLGLPWRMLRPHLVLQLTNGKVDYKMWLRDIVTEEKSSTHERLQSSLLESIYRNLSNLETIFSLIDTDCSGFISLDEFQQIWKLFSSHMNIDISDENICDLARSIDFNKDGKIDFNEFLEAFRLVKQTTSG
ncbi:serine/threonine-protein phosphatase with EF-hands 2 isoform X2 [Thamnophis elegans]|uniref:serine/threonine-protein phosphatase with EF-hands 2 isoform X2 n=1 Tax=Thamnophis elegans TaxID=35005 RepID=UPI001378AF50|nr:serine/threonine-protein phosphatase with EF-hands 2 isoform X2 [Thamnophis elegans]